MNAHFAQKRWLSLFYAVFGLSRVNDDIIKALRWVLESAGILSRLQYETHSLQTHTELPCRSAVAPTPKLSERRYNLRLVVVPVNIFSFCHRPSNPFCHFRRPTSLLLPSHISSSAVSIPVVPYILHRACPLLSSPLTFSVIPIIPHLHRASIVILPRLFYGSRRIIFHRPVYFVTVF